MTDDYLWLASYFGWLIGFMIWAVVLYFIDKKSRPRLARRLLEAFVVCSTIRVLFMAFMGR